MTAGSCALAVTARDEARLLAAHLAYHRLLGVGHAFVYLDEDGDATRPSLDGLEGVTVGGCASPDRYRGVPGLERFVDTWESHLEARQSLNVVDAMARAEAAGFEWLLSIDADELVCLDRREWRPGALPRALANVADGVPAVWLPNLEVVPSPGPSHLVFREARRFKRPGGPPRQVCDPRDGRVVCDTWFSGHAAGKSAVRLGRGGIPGTSHRFAGPDGEPLPTATLGELLHYHAYDFEDWLRRCRSYADHPPRHVAGSAVEAQKLLWIELVQTLEPAALESYYDRTLRLAPAEVRRLEARHWRRRFRRAVVAVDSVAEAFEREPTLKDY